MEAHTPGVVDRTLVVRDKREGGKEGGEEEEEEERGGEGGR